MLGKVPIWRSFGRRFHFWRQNNPSTPQSRVLDQNVIWWVTLGKGVGVRHIHHGEKSQLTTLRLPYIQIFRSVAPQSAEINIQWLIWLFLFPNPQMANLTFFSASPLDFSTKIVWAETSVIIQVLDSPPLVNTISAKTLFANLTYWCSTFALICIALPSRYQHSNKPYMHRRSCLQGQ